MEEELLEYKTYWTTDEIKNLNNPVSNEWVSRAKYDDLLRRHNTQGQAYKEVSEKYGEQRQDLFEFKDAVKIILRHYN